MGRRRYRRRQYTNWSEYHASERAKVSGLYGGVDRDVRQVFFSLSPQTLHQVLVDYKRQYGQRAYEYARKVYDDWKSGDVQMSGKVSERLLAIVPRHLDFAVKYDLLEKLCRRRKGTRLQVEITGDMTASEAFGTVLRTIENARSTKLPDHIAQRLHWLADNDGKVAQELLSQVFAREYEFIVRSVKGELIRLFAMASDLNGTSVTVQAKREMALPGLTVQILLNSFSRTRQGGRKNVSNDPQNQENSTPKSLDGALVPVNNPGQGGHIVPIQNPQNLLEEALKRMTPEKQSEVLDKAAEKALELEGKRWEHEVDLGIVSDKIEQARLVAREAAKNPNVDIHYDTVHRSRGGDTRITVSSKSGCLSVVLVVIVVFVVLAWIA